MASSITPFIEQPSAPQAPLTPKSAKIKELEESLSKTKLMAQRLEQQNALKAQIIQQQHAQNEGLQKEVVFHQKVAQRFMNATQQIQSEWDELLHEKIKDEANLRVVVKDNEALVASQEQLAMQNLLLLHHQQQVQIQNNRYRQICETAIQNFQAANAELVQQDQTLRTIANKPRLIAACDILVNGSQGFVDSAYREAQQNNPANQQNLPQIDGLDLGQIEHIV